MGTGTPKGSEGERGFGTGKGLGSTDEGGRGKMGVSYADFE